MRENAVPVVQKCKAQLADGAADGDILIADALRLGKRVSRMAGMLSPACASAVCHIRSSAQKRFTAVGRAEARYSFVSRRRAKKTSLSSVSICEAASASA